MVNDRKEIYEDDLDITEDNNEEDIYYDEGTKGLEEADEITESEEGFMKGYNEETDPSKCATCKKILEDEEFVEEEIDGEYYRFCSESCANKFKIHKQNL